MRRDQALFLGVGLVLGLIIGLLFGFVISKPELSGGSKPEQASAPAPAGQPAEGMAPVAAQLDALRKRLDANPNDADALGALGDLFLSANMRERAVEPYAHLATLAGSNAQLLMRAAAGLAQAGAPDQGLAAARKAMDADRKSAAPVELAADIAIRGLADTQTGEILLAELKRRAPDSAALGPLTQQLQSVSRIADNAKAKPNDYAAQVEAGNFFYDHSRWGEADAAYRRALAVAPKPDPNVLTDHGHVLFQLGKNEEALTEFDRALQAEPKQWQAAYNGVVVCLAMNDAGRARAWLGRLKAINPTHPSIADFERQLAGRT